MFFSDLNVFPDSVLVETYHGEPLTFKTESSCSTYIKKNLKELKQFGLAVYPEASAVKSISCVNKMEGTNANLYIF